MPGTELDWDTEGRPICCIETECIQDSEYVQVKPGKHGSAKARVEKA